MARKITTDAVEAFINGQEFSRDNTRVEVRPFQREAHDSVILLLYGNPIARHIKTQGLATLQVCDGNHPTNTTKERLNGLPGVSVHQKAGQWYLNGEKWDGSWTRATSVIVVKKLGLRSYGVEYPHAAAMPPMQFPSLNAARAFAEVEAANHGFKLDVEATARESRFPIVGNQEVDRERVRELPRRGRPLDERVPTAPHCNPGETP